MTKLQKVLTFAEFTNTSGVGASFDFENSLSAEGNVYVLLTALLSAEADKDVRKFSEAFYDEVCRVVMSGRFSEEMPADAIEAIRDHSDLVMAELQRQRADVIETMITGITNELTKKFGPEITFESGLNLQMLKMRNALAAYYGDFEEAEFTIEHIKLVFGQNDAWQVLSAK